MVSPEYPSCCPSSGGLEMLRELLASLPAALAYVAGPDLVVEFVSDGFRQGLGGRELVGRPFRDAVPEAVGQPLFEAIRQVLKTGETRQGRGEEIWVSRRPGAEPEQRYFDSVYRPVRDEAGRLAGVLIFKTDVTEHVRDRHQLQELADRLQRVEEQYRTLFQTLPHGIIRYARDGSLIGQNPAAGKILGLPPDHTAAERAKLTLHEDGTPYQPEELPAVVALRTGKVVPPAIAAARNPRTGEIRWIQVSAVPDAWDAQGQPQRAYSVFTDITDQRRAQAALQQSTRLLGALREANVLGVLMASEKGVLEANDAFLDMIGYTRGDLEAGRITWDAITPPEWVATFNEAIEQMRRTGAALPYEKEFLHRDGHRVPVLVGAAVLDHNPLRWTKFVVDLTARQRAERERAELLAREQAARLTADSAQDRLALLLKASNLMAATGSVQELRDQLARLLVPILADSSTVLLVTSQGSLRAASVIHRDPAKAAILEGLRSIDIPSDGPLLRRVLTEASIQIVTDVGAVLPGFTREAREAADILKRVNLDSMVIMPVIMGERTIGVGVLGRDDGRPRFTETDVAIIAEINHRQAAGWANVETFAREHTVAETLQHALLPDGLPRIAGVDLAVRYLPATGGVRVGGDWYDVFPLSGDRVALAVGDVVGHSIASASVMGQIRSMLRAYTVESPAPADVLRRTNAAVCELLPAALATVLYAVLDPSTGDLTYANAGHPPALVGGKGHVDYLDLTSGTMLGVSPDTHYTVGHRNLAPGASLLLYTDGLIEDRRRDINEGFDALAQAVRRCPGQTAERTCQCVQTAMLGSGGRDDDVCILAISLDNPVLPEFASMRRANRAGDGEPKCGVSVG
ncbi:MAG TPA: SpoIIE family protein phosphatase [Trebonia sp.]|nr:SpoIIE family protein phosphatase [Trebonia sp.]